MPNTSKLIDFIYYNIDQSVEKSGNNLRKLISKIDSTNENWININDLKNTDLIDQVGRYFALHPLTIEDVLSINHLPKCEDNDNNIFFTLKRLKFDKYLALVEDDHISFIIGQHYLISFQENKENLFNAIVERIHAGLGRVRKQESDYLFYLLIDTVVDENMKIIEDFSETIEWLEDQIIEHPAHDYTKDIHRLKKQLPLIRKALLPLRDAISKLMKIDSGIIRRDTIFYLQDVYDHTVHAIELYQAARDSLTSLIDLNMANMSNYMNRIMKTLTLVATIFIPLTFIVGIYGMNFSYMPELEWRWGYFVILGIMAVIALIMLIFMRLRRWL